MNVLRGIWGTTKRMNFLTVLMENVLGLISIHSIKINDQLLRCSGEQERTHSPFIERCKSSHLLTSEQQLNFETGVELRSPHHMPQRGCRLQVLKLMSHPQPLCLSSPKALSQKVVTEAACVVCQQIIRMVSNIPLLGAFLNPCIGNPKALLIFVTC